MLHANFNDPAEREKEFADAGEKNIISEAISLRKMNRNGIEDRAGETDFKWVQELVFCCNQTYLG